MFNPSRSESANPDKRLGPAAKPPPEPRPFGTTSGQPGSWDKSLEEAPQDTPTYHRERTDYRLQKGTLATFLGTATLVLGALITVALVGEVIPTVLAAAVLGLVWTLRDIIRHTFPRRNSH